MTPVLCGQVQQWIATAAESIPPETLVMHVQHCATCQTALLRYLSAHLDLPAPDRLTCDTVAEELAAMAEYEQHAGAAAAAQMFPALWWHLWTCPDCAEIYHDLLSYLNEPEEHDQMSRSLPAVHVPTISLPHGFLRTIFAPQLAAGAAWGSTTSARQLITEDEFAQGRIGLYMGLHDSQHWYVEVQITPAQSGTLLIGLDEQIYTATFQQQASVRIDQLPLSFLRDPHGTDFVLNLLLT